MRIAGGQVLNFDFLENLPATSDSRAPEINTKRLCPSQALEPLGNMDCNRKDVIVKVLVENLFIITAYFTDTIKRGEALWEKK